MVRGGLTPLQRCTQSIQQLQTTEVGKECSRNKMMAFYVKKLKYDTLSEKEVDENI